MSLIRRILLSSKSSDNGKNIMMTSQSNPEVMRICYWKGWAENPSYMTYEEAAAVTDTSAFNSAFNYSDIVYFNEAKYFTGITGTISFTAPRLREFAFLPNASGYDIGAKFPICYRYDIGVCTKLSLRNGVETIINPYIAEILVSPNNTIWAVTNGHLGKGQILYNKNTGAILWTTPDYKGGVIIYPKKYQQTNRGSVSYSYARYRGHTIVANNFYSGNVSFDNGGYYVKKIISFKNTYYYNNSSFPSNIGSRVPKSVVKEFIVSADDPKDFMADTNYTTNFLNPNVCNFQLRRVNFGITIYNEKALFPLKGLYADEYFMTKEECAEVTTLGDRFRNSDVEEFTELQYFTSLENIDNAFYGCIKLNTITLPSHITTIGNNAFANCSSLTSVTIPKGVTTIGNNAFANCSSLTSVTIPKGVTTIGNNAFANCSSLTSIVIPSTVTYIGDNAFSGCVDISIITMEPTTAPTLGENVWGDNESNYVGNNVSSIKYISIKGESIGYDTDKWNVLIDLGFNKTEYVYIEYIESNSDAWIDTGVFVNDSNYRIECEFMATKFTANGSIFADYYKDDVAITRLLVNATNRLMANYRSGNNILTVGNVINNKITSILESNKLIVNDTKYDITSYTINTNNPTPIILFNRGRDTIIHRDIGARIYWFKVYKDNELILDMIPVRIGNVGYMYDRVNGQLFGNSGTGEFTLGANL